MTPVVLGVLSFCLFAGFGWGFFGRDVGRDLRDFLRRRRLRARPEPAELSAEEVLRRDVAAGRASDPDLVGSFLAELDAERASTVAALDGAGRDLDHATRLVDGVQGEVDRLTTLLEASNARLRAIGEDLH